MKESDKKGADVPSASKPSPRGSLNINFTRILTSPEVPPKPGLKFFWTRVGSEIMLEVGYFDLTELKRTVDEANQAALESTATPVPLYITDRFFLTLASAIELSKVVKLMMNDLKENALKSGITEEAWKAQGAE